VFTLMRIVLDSSLVIAALRATVILAYLVLSSCILLSNLLTNIICSMSTEREIIVLLSVLPRYNVLIILTHLIYLQQLCGAITSGVVVLSLVLLIFVTVKGFGKITPLLYFAFPVALFVVAFLLQNFLLTVQLVHDKSLEIQKESKSKCTRRAGFAAKKIRSLQEIRLYLSIADFNLCYFKRSIKSAFNEYTITYSISLLLAVPASAVQNFFANYK